MKSLDCLTEECLDLLHKNRLLKPLISAELLKEELSNISSNSVSHDKVGFLLAHGLKHIHETSWKTEYHKSN